MPASLDLGGSLKKSAGRIIMRGVSCLSSMRLFMDGHRVLAISAVQLPQLFRLLDAPAATSCRGTQTNDGFEGCW